MTEQLPGIMLEALYGDDFEHSALDKLIRVARSYLDLATEDNASVAQRTKDIAAAIEVLESAGREILNRDIPPLQESWQMGQIEGLRAACTFLRTVERPEENHVLVFDVSLHCGDPYDAGTELGALGPEDHYERKPIEFAVGEGGVLVNCRAPAWEDMPLCRIEALGIWAGSRMLMPLYLNPPELVHDGDRFELENGSVELGPR